MFSTANNSVVINDDLVGYAKGDDFVAYANLQSRKLVTFSFRPFVLHVAKGRDVLHCANVFLHATERATQGSVDSIFGQQDSSA